MSRPHKDRLGRPIRRHGDTNCVALAKHQILDAGLVIFYGGLQSVRLEVSYEWESSHTLIRGERVGSNARK